MTLKKFSQEIISLILSDKISSKKQLNSFKLKLAKKYSLKDFPSNPAILSFAKNKKPELVKLLLIKPVRSLSGIVSVAIMPKPLPCPGKCIYCPSSLVDVKTPKSYTGREPTTMRAIANDFDAVKQIRNRIDQLKRNGHSTQKIELIIMGGTFLSASFKCQKQFMLDCFNAVNKTKSFSLEKAIDKAQFSENRFIGITFETRPDFCGKKEINHMLEFGGTRVELGVQTLNDEIYKKINRNHSVQDVINSTSLLRDSSFKFAYHLMPGLPYSTPKEDLRVFKKTFSDPDFKPDMLKIYPCLVIKNTELHDLWKKGDYTPYSSKQAAKLIAKMKSFVPKYTRIMRIQRDIPSTVVSAGVKHTNLRQLIEKEMEKHDWKCNCIRCREIGRTIESNQEPKIEVLEYSASKGKEFFISLETKNSLYGFCRMRFPFNPFRKEITSKTALIRELHIYSKSLPLNNSPKENEFQHKGFGKKLMQKAEEIALENSFNKINVISGIGAREYYWNLGFKNDGVYVSKKLN
ncbi:MAG: tRNA uridine(34) 5-carboxymethylaminomethyl modification radical SAM/GNAT enzyme Elp3 [Candidatus Diapherotrites archaeon CG10_big_fil_rev_8_21_14_0_10_31_34]|nr:MAG: tRNA uridine(34) 5-carboxymethylaminomethyl modification radical SAM/GNAT enzyme Elp3 [Candidatus Diapherotrites archaeon CG10_big_fil_rev_8_21_14_0_10_31_34]